ncbi:hypothetical protein [Nocardia ignorata]|uniref:Uncharacterized protein n=1 Tax=Nocardia ignorata TaxID=145285 RepID=A0A4R6PK20_NOCIG|nr:hypothetical protein [Nocardia ignorata]TDP38748.1 hypothetical protein DFR75_103405 [Nocardia ignorata]
MSRQGSYTPQHHDRDQVGRHALNSMGGAEFTGVGTVFAPLNQLPAELRLLALMVLVFVGMVGCSVAWIDQQSYVESPNICRAHEVNRTDCVHVQRVQPTRVPS